MQESVPCDAREANNRTEADATEAQETNSTPSLQRSDLSELATHPDETLAGIARTMLRDHEARISAAFEDTFDVDFSQVPDHSGGVSDVDQEVSARAVETATGGDGTVPPRNATTLLVPDDGGCEEENEEEGEGGYGHTPTTWDEDLVEEISDVASPSQAATLSPGLSADAPGESAGELDWDEELSRYGRAEPGGFGADRRPLGVDVSTFIPVGGDLADDDIARRVADRIAERAGWDASATRVLVEILEESSHHARQDAILRQIEQGVAPEALLAAFRTYSIWNEEYADNPYDHLSWDTATSLAESYAGYPDVDELMIHLERLHNAYCAARRAPGIRYRRYFSTYVREMLDDGIDDGWAVGDECVLRTAGYGIRA